MQWWLLPHCKCRHWPTHICTNAVCCWSGLMDAFWTTAYWADWKLAQLIMVTLIIGHETSLNHTSKAAMPTWLRDQLWKWSTQTQGVPNLKIKVLTWFKDNNDNHVLWIIPFVSRFCISYTVIYTWLAYSMLLKPSYNQKLMWMQPMLIQLDSILMRTDPNTHSDGSYNSILSSPGVIISPMATFDSGVG